MGDRQKPVDLISDADPDGWELSEHREDLAGWRIAVTSDPIVVDGQGPYAAYIDHEHRIFYAGRRASLADLLTYAFSAGVAAGREGGAV